MSAVADICKALRRLEHEKPARQILADVCEMAYCGMAQIFGADDARRAELEARYLRLAGSYQPAHLQTLPDILGMIAIGLQANEGDVLGRVAGELGALDAGLAQFFTPYELSRLIARMTLHDALPRIAERGYITVCEPASGAGGMVLAVAELIREAGYDPAETLLVDAMDLDRRCMHMTYVQLALAGVAAEVRHGDSLTVHVYERAWTPAAQRFFALHGPMTRPMLALAGLPEAAGLVAPDQAPAAAGVPAQGVLF